MSPAAAVLRSAPRGRVPETRALVAGASLAAVGLALAPLGPALALAAAACAGAGLWLRTACGHRAAPRDLARVALLGGFALTLNAVFTGGPPVAIGGWALPVSAAGLRVGAETAVRLVALLLLFQGVARAFSPFVALAGLERWLRPWRRPGGAVASFEVVLLVALRLAPSLDEEARRLSVQRALRGPWPGPGAPVAARRRRLAVRLREVPAVLVPLTLLVLRRAEELAWALPARYHGLGPRTPAELARWTAGDWTALLAGAAVLGGAAWARSVG
jgi:energy-coupling factor transporter transmembrane protein EcfT